MATPNFRSSSRPSTIDDILTLNPKVSFVFLEGFDDAVVGVGRTVTGALGVVYDRNKMVSILARDGYGPLMANKWIDDNVGNIDLGPHTPIIFDNVASI